MCKLRVGLLILCGAVAAEAADGVNPSRNAFVATKDPFGETVAKVVYLDQNWSPDESNRFYFTAQGSQIIPYDWFLALEQADSTTPFRDNQNILKYRYLAQEPGPLNPDGLPVGFVADQGVGRAWLGMTCAACHTNEIHLGGTAYRVDGAPTLGDIQGFLSAMIVAMQQTRADAAKFGRFATKVLGSHDSPPNRARLQAQLDFSIKVRAGYNLRNFPGYDPKAPLQPPTRFGRLDAVDSIVNEVYNFAVKNPNPDMPTVVSKTANAAVSYPCPVGHPAARRRGVAGHRQERRAARRPDPVEERRRGPRRVWRREHPQQPRFLRLRLCLDRQDLGAHGPGKPAQDPLVAAVAGRLSQDRPGRRREGGRALPDRLRHGVLPGLPRPDQPDRPQPQGRRGHGRQRDRPAGVLQLLQPDRAVRQARRSQRQLRAAHDQDPGHRRRQHDALQRGDRNDPRELPAARPPTS